MSQKALFVNPFAFADQHHGARRMRRFAEWLTSDGWLVSTVTSRAARDPIAIEHQEVADPLGLWPLPLTHTSVHNASLKASRIRGRGLGRHLVPDSSIGWALATLASRGVHRLAHNADVIVSTSPPESTHVAASLLARRHGKAHIVDMRDGWLDEPLKAELTRPGVRRLLEGRLERWVLNFAKRILVTSPEWKVALADRYPHLEERIRVVRNTVPPLPRFETSSVERVGPRWVYAGRFGESRISQNASQLLPILAAEARAAREPIEFRFVGALHQMETTLLDTFARAIHATRCSVVCTGHLTHADAMDEICAADALLLLCCSVHALPSKLFEYVATGRPILAVCRPNTATWNACGKISSAMCVDPDAPIRGGDFVRFMQNMPTEAPDSELSVATARAQLLEAFRECASLKRCAGTATCSKTWDRVR